MKNLLILVTVLTTLCSMAQQSPALINNKATHEQVKEKEYISHVLRIGDVAPPIKARWIKGLPVQNFDKDMVYVLEFWATWCGPCIKAMPHLSELAKKYAGKATFIGVSVWERGQPGQTLNEFVDKFMKEKGHIMEYAVAMDGSNSYMVTNWVEAAGESSIPATIVVGKNGKIAWIGQPLSLDEPLSKIIDGTFDSNTFAAQKNAELDKKFRARQVQAARSAFIKPAEDALKEKNYKLAMAEYNKIIAEDPSYKDRLASLYYTTLLHLNPKQAFEKAKLFKDSVAEAATFAQVFATEDGLDKKFYKYAIDFYEGQPENHFNFPSMSSAYFNYGNISKAIEIQQKWIDKLKTFTAPAPASYVEREMERLQKYKNAAKL